MVEEDAFNRVEACEKENEAAAREHALAVAAARQQAANKEKAAAHQAKVSRRVEAATAGPWPMLLACPSQSPCIFTQAYSHPLEYLPDERGIRC